MTTPESTIAEKLQTKFDSLTRAERQLANSLLDNYPVSGLASITTVAQNAEVSTPTVARMVQKLGFKGTRNSNAHFVVNWKREFPIRLPNTIIGQRRRLKRIFLIGLLMR